MKTEAGSRGGGNPEVLDILLIWDQCRWNWGPNIGGVHCYWYLPVFAESVCVPVLGANKCRFERCV